VNETTEQELKRISTEWDRAMVANDADEIARYVTDDWVLIGTDGNVGSRDDFLDLVRSGELSHDVMDSSDFRIRVYGDAALLVARGVSGGKFRGETFHLVERVSCMFVRQNGQWRCASTHLSEIAGE